MKYYVLALLITGYAIPTLGMESYQEDIRQLSDSERRICFNLMLTTRTDTTGKLELLTQALPSSSNSYVLSLINSTVQKINKDFSDELRTTKISKLRQQRDLYRHLVCLANPLEQQELLSSFHSNRNAVLEALSTWDAYQEARTYDCFSSVTNSDILSYEGLYSLSSLDNYPLPLHGAILFPAIKFFKRKSIDISEYFQLRSLEREYNRSE